MKRRFLFFLACFLVFFLTMDGFANSKKPYKILETDTFFEMESVRNPSISPDGKQIIFTRTWVDKMNDRFRSNLWIVDFEGKRARELTHGNWRDHSPVWSPDGKKIAFLSERDGSTQIHVMWVDTKEVAQLTHLEREPSNISWSPDGNKIVFTYFIPDEKQILPVKLPKKPAKAKWGAPAVIIDRLSWRADGRGPLPKGYQHIFIIDAELGGTPFQITSGDYPHSEPAWAPDGKTVYFSGIRKPDVEYQFGDTEIYSVNLETLEIKALTDRKGPDRNPTVSPDGKWIAYTGYDEKNYTFHLSNLYLMDKNGGNKRVLAQNLHSSPSSLTWAPDGSGVYFLLSEKGTSNLYFVSIDGKLRKVTEGVHFISSYSLSKTGHVALVISDFYRPGYLATAKILKPENLKKLLDINEDVLKGVKLGKVEESGYK